MTIDFEIDQASKMDVGKSNNAAMEMEIADFFISRISLTGLLSLVVFNSW